MSEVINALRGEVTFTEPPPGYVSRAVRRLERAFAAWKATENDTTTEELRAARRHVQQCRFVAEIDAAMKKTDTE